MIVVSFAVIVAYVWVVAANLIYLLYHIGGVLGFLLGLATTIIGGWYVLFKMLNVHKAWFDKNILPRCRRCGGGMRSYQDILGGGKYASISTYCPTCDRSTSEALEALGNGSGPTPAATTRFMLLIVGPVAIALMLVFLIIGNLQFWVITEQTWLVRAKLAISGSCDPENIGREKRNTKIYAPLRESARRKDLATFKLLYEKCIDGSKIRTDLEMPSFDVLIASPDIFKYLAGKKMYDLLRMAAERDRADAAATLIAWGGNVNWKDRNNETLLHTAGRCGAANAAAVLIEHGARVEEKDDDGYTSLHRAVMGNRPDTARLLIEKGADVNARTNNGSTPLHVAARMGRLEVASLLLEKGAKVNLRTVRPWANVNFGEKTPLHEAVWEEKAEVAELLIRKGADVNARTTEQLTPLWMAKKKENAKLVNILKRAGAR